MAQQNQKQHFRQYKLIFFMYIGTLAVYSSWSQGPVADVEPLKFSPEMEARTSYLHQENIETAGVATGVLLKSTAQQFIAIQTVPEWVINANSEI
jgi:hypothetical protein